MHIFAEPVTPYTETKIEFSLMAGRTDLVALVQIYILKTYLINCMCNGCSYVLSHQEQACIVIIFTKK